MNPIQYYFQVDFIDKQGLATYVETYHDIGEAIKNVNLLNFANKRINRATKFVLDIYQYNPQIEDSDKVIAYNITNAETITERLKRLQGNNQ